MIALDTNVVVRFLVADDPGQFARARQLVETSPVLLLTTVAMETEWVLRSLYRLPPSSIAGALDAISRLRSIALEDEVVLRSAIRSLQAGGDFADAIHAGAARHAGASYLATFDKALAKRAGLPPGAMTIDLDKLLDG